MIQSVSLSQICGSRDQDLKMGIWRRMKREFLVIFSGLQEATVAVADRVHRRVQQVKSSIDAGLLEKQIEVDQALLGEKIYRKGHSDLRLLYKDPELHQLYTKVQEQQKKLVKIEAVNFPYESYLEFEQILLESDFLINRAVISEDFGGLGKKIQDLLLPASMRIILVRKRNQVELAKGTTRIELYDEVIFLTSKGNLQQSLEYWGDH